jgi:hypothetical protein
MSRPKLYSTKVWFLECSLQSMQNSRRLRLLPLLFLPFLLSQCNRPSKNVKDVPALEKNGTNIDGNPATGAAPASGQLPSGISAAGDQGNRPQGNPNNPQTNPGTNLDGTQTPTPDKRSASK